MNTQLKDRQPPEFFMMMDPGSGEIECFVPTEPNFGDVISEGEGVWRAVTAAESMESWILMEPLPLHYEGDVGTEFDVKFEHSLNSFGPAMAN